MIDKLSNKYSLSIVLWTILSSSFFIPRNLNNWWLLAVATVVAIACSIINGLVCENIKKKYKDIPDENIIFDYEQMLNEKKNRNKVIQNLIIAVFVFAVALLATNPNDSEFITHLKNSKNVDSINYERMNLFLVSFYFSKQGFYLGILNNFYEINRINDKN